jgi:hypothetical protein
LGPLAGEAQDAPEALDEPLASVDALLELHAVTALSTTSANEATTRFLRIFRPPPLDLWILPTIRRGWPGGQ